jgi:uncharacterized protein
MPIHCSRAVIDPRPSRAAPPLRVRSRPVRQLLTWPLLALAIAFPTVAAWLYFMTLAGHPSMGSAYFAAKVLQALLPLVGWWVLRLPRDRVGGTTPAGVGSGLLSGIALAVPVLGLYALALRGTPLLAAAPAQIRARLEPFGAAEIGGFVLLALGLSLVHSLFEEYYWRWFLFGALRRRLAVGSAAALSSLAFAAHHAIVIAGLLGPAAPLFMVAAGTLAVALAGVNWVWLFHRFGSLLPPWLSHVVVDLAFMAIGYELLWGW